MTRLPFHFGLFYNAMVGLLGRKPDKETCLGGDGYYEFIYKPNGQAEKDLFERDSITIKEWLDLFKIQFSGSRCEFSSYAPTHQDKGEKVLQIKIATETE